MNGTCDWSRRDFTLDARIQTWWMAAAALDGCVWLSATGNMVTHDISGVWCGTEQGYFEGGVLCELISLWGRDVQGGWRSAAPFLQLAVLEEQVDCGEGDTRLCRGLTQGTKDPAVRVRGLFSILWGTVKNSQLNTHTKNIWQWKIPRVSYFLPSFIEIALS